MRGRAFASAWRAVLARRRLGIAAGLGLVALLGLTIWGALAATAWMWTQAQGWSRAGPGAAPYSEHRVERPRRDVTGTDLGPVARYPGLARTYWHREGRQVVVEYEGRAEFRAVLGHYQAGFAANGYTGRARSVTPSVEAHDYTKGRERVALTISQRPGGQLSVHIETALK